MFRVLWLLAAVACLASCASVRYYSQAVGGHLDLMARREPIDRLLLDPETPEALKDRLREVQRMRRFAVTELQLPDNDSYTHYADLERDAAVWLLTAAPELSLEPRQWCYLVVGCLSYRGYFDRARAEATAAELRQEGYDTRVSPGLAYSTLGFMADPVLNTMLVYDDEQLAGLLFHELAHQVLYLRGDARFSESFASTVEAVGRERWLAAEGTPAERAQLARERQRGEEFNQLMLGARAELADIYRGPADAATKRREKRRVFEELEASYHEFRSRWDDYRGYDFWFRDGPNNADLALLATYELAVDAFLALLEREDGNLADFYRAVEALSRQEPEQRWQTIEALRETRQRSSGALQTDD